VMRGRRSVRDTKHQEGEVKVKGSSGDRVL
jgi:hypothetical protein